MFILDGGRGHEDGRKTYLDLILREPTQVMRVVLLEASHREHVCGIHTCPIMTTCAPHQPVKPVMKESTGLGRGPFSPFMYMLFGDDGLESVGGARCT